MAIQEESQYKLFFDESTVQATDSTLELSLMGSLIVPEIFYNLNSIQEENSKLQNGEYKLHFTDFRGPDKNKYTKVLKLFLSRPDLLKFNVLCFEKEGNYLDQHIAFSKENMTDMIYSKLPERTIYGGIRNVSKFTPASYDIYIEKSNHYTSLNIHNTIKKQLNSQALYRNDSFKINNSNLYTKNQELGIEVTDTLLGIVSLIIRNPSKYKEDGTISKRRKAKLKFIYNNRELLKSFLPSITYYELDKNGSLTQRSFDNFFYEFILKYEKENR